MLPFFVLFWLLLLLLLLLLSRQPSSWALFPTEDLTTTPTRVGVTASECPRRPHADGSEAPLTAAPPFSHACWPGPGLHFLLCGPQPPYRGEPGPLPTYPLYGN